jgi:hypothetical protein
MITCGTVGPNEKNFYVLTDLSVPCRVVDKEIRAHIFPYMCLIAINLIQIFDVVGYETDLSKINSGDFAG